MQNHQKIPDENTKVVALRVPHSTYVILLERSKDWQMSVSSLIRELVIKVFNDQEMSVIKSYKKRGIDDGTTSKH